jgi:uncharacterized protein (UPF0332 family)
VKPESFASSLVRKSERAIRSAHLSLRDGDADSDAMFNVARAALLSAGVQEGNLPRTHRGLIEAFRIHAVQTGRIETDMASSLSRTENLRLKADYTATEIDTGVAKEVVAHAEKFVQTVERVFGLETPVRQIAAEKGSSQERDGVSQSDTAIVGTDQSQEPLGRAPTLEETQRKAAENWRRNYYDKRASGLEPEMEPAGGKEKSLDTDKTRSDLDAGLDFDPEH